MLWTIFVILVVLWLLGFSLHIGGGLIHILIVIAVVVLIYNLITGATGSRSSRNDQCLRRVPMPCGEGSAVRGL